MLQEIKHLEMLEAGKTLFIYKKSKRSNNKIQMFWERRKTRKKKNLEVIRFLTNRQILNSEPPITKNPPYLTLWGKTRALLEDQPKDLQLRVKMNLQPLERLKWNKMRAKPRALELSLK